MKEESTLPERYAQCLDGLDQHCDNIEALAKLLELCRYADHGLLQGKVVAHAADLITRELEGMRNWKRQLEEWVSRLLAVDERRAKRAPRRKRSIAK
jgi:hypothetical protein